MATASTSPTQARTTRKRKSTRASFGSVRRLPSGRYQARYSDDRMNRHTAPHTFETKTAAEEWLATIRADVVRGTWRAPELGKVTVADYAADHLATRLDLSPRTQRLYADLLAGWIDRPLALRTVPGRPGCGRSVHLGQLPLNAVSVEAVREWYAAALNKAAGNAQRRAESRRRTQMAAATHNARSWALANNYEVKSTGRLPGAVLKAWTAAGSPAARVATDLGSTAPTVAPDAGRAQVAQAYRFLRMVMAHAVREARIDANPCQIARAGHVKAAERIPATPAEVSALAAGMPARYSAAVHLAGWSGLRAGELFGLARRHVDLETGTVRVERAVTYAPGQPAVFGSTKTEGSRRTVHLPPHVVAILRQHMTTYTGPGPDALIFTDPAGRIVPREARKVPFWRARALIGRPDLRWHDLRHTGATLAAQAGATLAELQHRLGHTTAAAAMIYQHHSADRDKELAQRLSLLAEPPTDNVHRLGARRAGV